LKSYTETLGEAFKVEENQVEEDNHSPEILRSEFERALKDLKNGKAPGEDKISGEVIKKLGEKAQNVLYGITQDCYQSGKLPEDFWRSLMVIIPKRARAEKCEEHRTRESCVTWLLSPYSVSREKNRRKNQRKPVRKPVWI
jgi:hypothetical protein